MAANKPEGSFRPRAAFPPLRGVGSSLRAGLDQGHAGVGETEMMTDLVDQHVADDAVHRLAGPVGVTEEGGTIEKILSGRLAGSDALLNGRPTP